MESLDARAREVIDKSAWCAIATTGAEGPHLAACWTRNVLALGYTDTEIRLPIWRLERTERNLLADPRIELLFVAADVHRTKGDGQGLSVLGLGTIHRSGPRAEEVAATLPWSRGALVVAVTDWRLHLP